MQQINAIGDACPLPVIKTRKALKDMPSGRLEVLVDNEIAVQNIKNFVTSMGCSFASDRQGDHYVIQIEKPEGSGKKQEAVTNSAEAEPAQTPVFAKTVVAISSDAMGSGDDELGRILMKGFVFALTQLEALPDTVLLYNSGARLSTQGAETLNDLITLEKVGVRIKTCGTCLNHFGIADKLGVGEVTNTYNVVEEMRYADRIMRP